MNNRTPRFVAFDLIDGRLEIGLKSAADLDHMPYAIEFEGTTYTSAGFSLICGVRAFYTA